MYDSWVPETKKYFYDHNGNKSDNEDEELENIMKELGFDDYSVIPNPKIEEISDSELKQIDVMDIAIPDELIGSSQKG